MKTITRFLFLWIIIILFTSGIGRDDVQLSKYLQFAKAPQFDCVGEIYYKREFQITCILLDSTHLLTAAHAFFTDSGAYHRDSVFNFDLNRFVYGYIAEKQIVRSPKNFSVKIGGKKYKTKRFVIHEAYLNAKPYRDEYGIHASEDEFKDLAIIELANPVDDIAPAVLCDTDNELNKRAVFAGFGEVERANEFTYDSIDSKSLHKRRKMAGENMIDSLGGYKIGNNWAGLYIDFDDPNSNCCNRMGSAKPLPLEYFPSAGDCGSGLFININGIWKLAGFCASTPEDYTEIVNYGKRYKKYYGFTAYYDRIFVYKDWIEKQLKN